MLRYFRRHAGISVVGLAALLSGCSQLTPPSIPSGTELLAYEKASFLPYMRPNAVISTKDRVLIGMAYVDEQCSDFFDAVEQSHRYVAIGKSTLLTSSTQVATLMTIAKKSAMNIATVAAAVEITKIILEQFESEFTFAPHSVQLRALVQASMNAQAENRIRPILESGGSISEVEAIKIIKKYAANCTLSAIHEAWIRAMGKAVSEGVVAEAPKTTNAPPPPAPPAPPTESYRYRTGGSGGVLGISKYVVR